MGRPKRLTKEQAEKNKIMQNKANYNRIIASQQDKKRFYNCCTTIERYLAGVEKINSTKNIGDERILVDSEKLEQLLKRAKQINLNSRIYDSVSKIMSDKADDEGVVMHSSVEHSTEIEFE
jgi:hypothetical protein